MRFVMLGGPGSGKGTQSHQLSHNLNIPVISVGNILRDAIATNTPLGLKAQNYVTKGELVPDEIMIQFMRQRLLKPDVNSGWILEGYPRTAFQAEELDFLLDELNQRLDWAIYLQVNESVMIERSLKRGFPDDKPEILYRRIEMFTKSTIPILEYYDYRGRLLTIEANVNPESVTQKIQQHLNQ